MIFDIDKHGRCTYRGGSWVPLRFVSSLWGEKCDERRTGPRNNERDVILLPRV